MSLLAPEVHGQFVFKKLQYLVCIAFNNKLYQYNANAE